MAVDELPADQRTDAGMLAHLQRKAFEYFRLETNAELGLVADATRPQSPSSIAAIGMGLTSLAIAAERGWISRAEAAGRTVRTLRFFRGSPQGQEPDATGYRGFYYHF